MVNRSKPSCIARHEDPWKLPPIMRLTRMRCQVQSSSLEAERLGLHCVFSGDWGGSRESRRPFRGSTC